MAIEFQPAAAKAGQVFLLKRKGCILCGMQDHTKKPPSMPTIAAITGVLLLLTIAGMLGWIRQGPDMFLALAESGLSWCL